MGDNAELRARLTRIRHDLDEVINSLAPDDVALFAIGFPDGKGDWNLWNGPVPSLTAMLLTDGEHEGDCILRVYHDRAPDVERRWVAGKWVA